MAHLSIDKQDLQFVVQVFQIIVFSFAQCFILLLRAYKFVIASQEKLRWLHWKFHYTQTQSSSLLGQEQFQVNLVPQLHYMILHFTLHQSLHLAYWFFVSLMLLSQGFLLLCFFLLPSCYSLSCLSCFHLIRICMDMPLLGSK